MDATELLAALREASREGVLGDLVAEAKKEPEREKTPAERLVAQLTDTHVVHPVLLAEVLDELLARVARLEKRRPATPVAKEGGQP